MNERYRRAVILAGIVALGSGVYALVAVRGGDVPAFSAALNVGGGVLALVMAVRLYRDWLPNHVVDPPDVERVPDHSIPGTDVDRTLARLDGRTRGYVQDRVDIHDRLRELAIEILIHRMGYSHDDAVASLDAAEWPDDPDVAAFLSDPETSLSRSVPDRVRALFEKAPSDFQLQVRQAVDTLAAESGLVDFEGQVGDRVAPGGSSVTGGSPGRQRLSPAGAQQGAASDGTSAGESLQSPRWHTAVPVALGLIGLGFLLQRTGLVLAGAAPLGLLVYARALDSPSASIAIERSIDPPQPDPGDTVEVTTTVHNTGDRRIPDLRIVDGVPPALAVTGGSPRYGVSLGAGQSSSFSYDVRARRGAHEFAPSYALVRGYAGRSVDVQLVEATRDPTTSIVCVPSLEALPIAVPLYEQPGDYLGRIPAEGGEGVEFHATREYRQGDPTTRIDWKRLARSPNEELTSVQFREDRAATVAIVIDADPSAYLAPESGVPSAVERSITAAGGLFPALLDTGDRVGIAALGPTSLWLTPDTGLDHRKRAEQALATDPAFPPSAPEIEAYHPHWVLEFHRRFPTDTQVILLSSLCNRWYRFVIPRLRAYSHPVTIVSPDPTAAGTVGQRLVRLERRVRIEVQREAGVRVLDWAPDEDLAVALERAANRWSR